MAHTSPELSDAVSTDANVSVNALIRQKEYEFSAETIDKSVNTMLSQQGRKANIKGFRPGKAPLSVLRRLFGKDMLERTLMGEAQRQFSEDMQSASERAAAAPFFSPSGVAVDNVYRVSCQYEVLPDVGAPDFSGKSLKIPTLSVGDAEVSEMIDILRRRHGKYVATTTPATAGHRVLVDFASTGGDDATVVEEGKDRLLTLGDKHLRIEFNQALEGAQSGDVRSAELVVPDDHPNERLRGGTITTKITVKEVQVLEPAMLDNDFFSAMGVVEGGGEEKFREMVGKHLQREVSVRLRNFLQRRALDVLVAATPDFPLPEVLVYHESSGLLQRARQHWQQQGGDAIASSLRLENFVDEARRRVSLGLVLSAWQKRHSPDISDADKEARLDEIAEAYESPDAAKAQMRANPQQMEAVHLSVLEDKVTDWVRTQATSEEEKLSLAKLLGDDAEAAA